MAEAFNNLTPAQAERIAKLIEECGELQHALGKTLIHGWESTHPRTGVTNVERVRDEAADVIAAIKRMVVAGEIDAKELLARSAKKLYDNTYLHHQDNE